MLDEQRQARDSERLKGAVSQLMGDSVKNIRDI